MKPRGWAAPPLARVLGNCRGTLASYRGYTRQLTVLQDRETFERIAEELGIKEVQTELSFALLTEFERSLIGTRYQEDK